VTHLNLTRFALLLFATSPATLDEPGAAPRTAPWGAIETSEAPGTFLLRVSRRPGDGIVPLPVPFAEITRAYLADDAARGQLPLEFNADASGIRLRLPESKNTNEPALVVVETAEKSGQVADGRIVLVAIDATVTGKTARLESHRGNHRIGFWTDAADFVSWSHAATRPGTYEVELTYSLEGGEGTDARIAIGEKALDVKLPATGSWYSYGAKSPGKVSIPAPGKIQIAVRCLKKTGAAVMNLKAVTLRPASEGNPVVQAGDGSVTCHARDVTIHGVLVQYEPRPEKNTVGFWLNEKDRVSWELTIAKPGRFQVEVLQGCGKGQGGSEVEMELAGQTLRFTVEDTGHFQNFVPRTIGAVNLEKPGAHALRVKPVRKAKDAVMDLRQVRLVPVES
jgi:hypothetical protein